jgi:hypothetical protein
LKFLCYNVGGEVKKIYLKKLKKGADQNFKSNFIYALGFEPSKSINFLCWIFSVVNLNSDNLNILEEKNSIVEVT